ncbi:MAG: hypothetical protein ACPGVD_03855 [Flavobacteriales bacterium]
MGQLSFHMDYSNWTNIPLNGYNSLQKNYWKWDEESKALLD